MDFALMRQIDTSGGPGGRRDPPVFEQSAFEWDALLAGQKEEL